MRLKFVFILLIFISVKIQAQTVNGRVISESSGQALPFVSIIYNNHKDGISTDIDGNFSLEIAPKVEFLKFSYVGYETIFIPKEKIPQNREWIIRMKEKEFKLDEVVVFPGENPAHRIIKAVVKNRKFNNPEKLKSYAYTAYHKMIFTVDMDNPKVNKNYKPEKLPQDSISIAKRDSVLKAAKDTTLTAQEFFAKQNLFIMESVSETKFKQPDLKSEKVIMSRVSGFKQPSFVLLASQFQSFSIYEDMITLAESRYVNPIAQGSWNKYFFNIEDTSYTSSGDTVFIISFRPKKGKNFEALQGVLNINTYKYAVQSITARPVENEGVIGVEIRQNYTLVDNKYWFPKELDTKLIFNSIELPKDSLIYYMIAKGKSYLKDITINKEITRKEIGNIDFYVADKAFKQPDSLWQKYRQDSLSAKDLKTYQVLDSIGDAEHLDLKLKVFKVLAKGYIPVKFINLDLTKLMDWTVYEGFRLGIGAHTNDKLIKNISLGGYFAYGFGDDEWKYGGNLKFNIYPRRDMMLNLSYQNDLEESSGYDFLQKPGFSVTESYRWYFIKDMTYNEQYAIDFQFRPMRKVKILLNTNQSTKYNTSGWYYQDGWDAYQPEARYRFFETGMQIAYTPKERLSYIAGELMNSYGSAPSVYLNAYKGYKNQWGDFDYWKIETKILLSALTKNFGKTDIVITAGKVFGDLPYFELYNGHGSYYDFTIETANSFATMRMNEFLSDQFAALYFRQDFGSLLFKGEKFRPQIVLVTNIGIGSLARPDLQRNLAFETMEKGYYESGILLNRLFKSSGIMGIGFGAFYRYGPYALPETKNNFAYKLSFTFDW
ncbi:MAG: DUF5686 and carboxypeptidase regulatory-like domain-containing protein [Bacteroidales bacterium]|nr:DUF5686 and carboxypeptidase regulatory-like domain-containing protein [Bacteroidales bacterium]